MKIEMQEKLLKYEAQGLHKTEAVELFEYLMSSGTLWLLPTEYLDIVATLLESGVIGPKRLKGMHS